MTVPPEVKEESVGTEHKEYSDSQTSVTPVKYVRTVSHFQTISWSVQRGSYYSMPDLHCRIWTPIPLPIRTSNQILH